MRKIYCLLMCCLAFGFVACNDDDKDKDNSSSSAQSGVENGHEWVDLGLTSGTKWATMNVGATNPQDYGNYYAWGETTAKATYNWSSYKYGSASNQLTKYCNGTDYGKDGFTDKLTVLELSDDAAYANWGGKWRIPTMAQQQELLDECYWVWTSNYNSTDTAGYIVYKAKTTSDKGQKITSGETPSSDYSISDAHIFLPAAGYRNDGDLNDTGSFGFYRSSSLYADHPGYAWYADFYTDYVSYDYCSYRSSGLSVRAVCTVSE